MDLFLKYFAVGLGGAVGAMARFYLGSTSMGNKGAPFPTATFIINISGSFIIGFFLTLATEKIPLSPYVRLAVAVGFVGAYTTFSTFEYETARLIEKGNLLYAFLNVLLSFVIGLAAVFSGIFLARKIESVPVTSSVIYDRFEAEADLMDPMQSEGAERDIKDSLIRPLKTRRNQGRSRWS